MYPALLEKRVIGREGGGKGDRRNYIKYNEKLTENERIN